MDVQREGVDVNEYEQIEYGPVEPVIVRREPLPTIANLQSRIEELERLKPLMEERKWLVQAKMELSKVKRLLREKNRKRQESA